MFSERVLLADGLLMELSFHSPLKFLLSLRQDGSPLVEYAPGHRMLRGRRSGYEFKSVEKLRYDFERDAEDALRQG